MGFCRRYFLLFSLVSLSSSSLANSIDIGFEELPNVDVMTTSSTSQASSVGVNVSASEISPFAEKQGNLRDPLRKGKGKGREGVVVFLLFGFLTVAQSGLLMWKKKTPKSYYEATLFGLWICPITLMLFLQFWVFCFLWLTFSLVNGYYVKMALAKPLHANAPFLVYQWFDRVQKVTYSCAMLSYMVLVVEVVGLRRIFSKEFEDFISFSCLAVLCYSAYFGVLGRDCATVCAERISSSLGYTKYEQPPPNLCALCGKELVPSKLYEALPESQGKVFKLGCGHEFHEKCIRGWAIVGKKDTCPFCSEKVDVKKILGRNPWDSSHMWLQFLDIVRYLVVWNPILLVGFRLFMYFYDFIMPA
mmetsp:Transcript_10567/g.12015  ORF Transcript_10567/g.12015 Transcript_10567/m.12015 type:complete len:360 (+) Transcript_10567:157-1236(+)|eukprot:CAMPEP_0204825146 /NCGR_PEP_ID=MMETSP1346-20131115/3076_1 /ASSEMBLY_ACC=CAM_ASM_000771 /TAXON_ID=215587 /ORGANISM="Aplanochytrium stocchinoi, Strain GSBS06" /LENGTH=359 /DNA_ID=CAMNT_0051952655 /DNA_START=390 /DNA_END=1469 /DNA_ORIENTATION=-